MLRYIRRLGDRDLALDRCIIPLGSCTMKLNATSEMVPVTWPEFGSLHPFAPPSQTLGYQEMFRDLQARLCDITGYDAVSLQPNSGAQGEYAGLLAIRAYHKSRGEAHRNVCVIPSSAHGTNPASAYMAGMEVVVASCDTRGNVDIEDLEVIATHHKEECSPPLWLRTPQPTGFLRSKFAKSAKSSTAAGAGLSRRSKSECPSWPCPTGRLRR